MAAISFSSAQFYDSGQDPSAFRWQQIKTPHFNIVFPDSAIRVARQLSRALEAGYEKGAYTLKVEPKKMTVVLHPSSVFSNAYVAWAPRRMEFVTTPPQNNDVQDWNDQLALHEYRHLVQLTSVNRGLTRVLSWFFGEQVTAGVMGTFVPFWFIEGDATLTETLLSNAGRGRLPSFDVALRAQLIEKGSYSYDKAVFGSYRNFVPDHYVLGYHIVTMARRDFGSGIWDNAVHKAGSCPIMITPFNHEIRKSSGLSKVKLYKRCMQQLDSLWQQELQGRSITIAERISPATKHYTNFNQPSLLGNSEVIAIRTGINEVRSVVRIDTAGRVHRLFTPGYYSNSSLSSAGTQIVWAEAGYDPRWENRNYSNLWQYDLIKHRKKKLSARSRLFAPSLSPNGERIICVAVDLQNINALEIRSSRKGRLLHQLKFPFGMQIMTPDWSTQHDRIVAVIMDGTEKKLLVTDSNLQHQHTYSPQGISDLYNPVMQGSRIYFSSGSLGTDQIYVFDTLSKRTFRVTESKFGAYEPELTTDGSFLLFSEYTADGSMISKIKIDTASWQQIHGKEKAVPRIFEPLLSQEQGLVINTDTSANYPIKRYYKFLHLLNPHSWGPLSVNADRQTVNPGLTLMSQNKLTTLVSTIGWEYNLMEKAGTYFANVSFRQWYPIIDLRFSYGMRSSPSADTTTDQRTSWTETSLTSSLRIPLNLSSGKWLRWTQLRFASSYYKIDQVKNYPDNAFIGYIRTFDYQAYWSSQTLAAAKDIEPRWAQSLVFDYRHTPFDGYMLGDIMAVRSSFNFPGIGKHHTFYITAAGQRNTLKPFKYADIIAWPRGVRDEYLDEFLSLSANYTLPLAYPDLHCGSVFYMKRIWMNTFVDHAQGSYSGIHKEILTTGLELYTDIHFFRFLAPFTLGGRLTYLTGTKKILPEFLYSLNLSGIQ